jgi:RimJ/RimL family protein N-acetyltransferase
MEEDILVTPRLRLLPLGPDDVALVCEHWNASPVREALWGGVAVSPEVVEEQLEISEVDFETDAFGLWRVEAGDVPCVGVVGLRQAAWRDGIELMFSIDQGWWGHGYATESVKAVLARAIVEVQLREVVAVSPPQHRAALRVLHKAGMRPVGEAKIQEIPLAVFVARHPLR